MSRKLYSLTDKQVSFIQFALLNQIEFREDCGQTGREEAADVKVASNAAEALRRPISVTDLAGAIKEFIEGRTR